MCKIDNALGVEIGKILCPLNVQTPCISLKKKPKIKKHHSFRVSIQVLKRDSRKINERNDDISSVFLRK